VNSGVADLFYLHIIVSDAVFEVNHLGRLCV